MIDIENDINRKSMLFQCCANEDSDIFLESDIPKMRNLPTISLKKYI